MAAKICPPKVESASRRSLAKIVGIIKATKPLRLDWRDPQYVQGLIDLGQEPEGLPDLKAGAEVD